jgi:hypothetical protein
MPHHRSPGISQIGVAVKEDQRRAAAGDLEDSAADAAD